MFVGRHWQHFDVSIRELHQTICVIRQPEIISLTPIPSLWKERRDLPRNVGPLTNHMFNTLGRQTYSPIVALLQALLAVYYNIWFSYLVSGARHRYIRNTPYFVAPTGAFAAAERPSASVRRVSAGSMMPSSHSRAEE
jgi:hypothetical protein